MLVERAQRKISQPPSLKRQRAWKGDYPLGDRQLLTLHTGPTSKGDQTMRKSKNTLHLYVNEFELRYNQRLNADIFGAAGRAC